MCNIPTHSNGFVSNNLHISLHETDNAHWCNSQPIGLSEQMIRCSLPLSVAVAAVYQMVMEQVKIDSKMAELKFMLDVITIAVDV